MEDTVVPANQRGLVKARDHDIDLAQKLGKTQVISANTPLSQQGGYPLLFIVYIYCIYIFYCIYPLLYSCIILLITYSIIIYFIYYYFMHYLFYLYLYAMM